MKIVLIDLPHIYLMQQRTQAPLGLMYLASVLENNNYDVEIVRLSSLDESDPENFIPNADLYGISSVSLDYTSAKVIGNKLKKRKNSKVIIGGYHATAERFSVEKEIGDDNELLWDSVCVGEFEISILTIMEDLKNDNLKRVYVGDRVSDLDTIPFPARHQILYQGGSIFAYNKHYSKNRLSTVICSSRGCPFNCCFCATSVMWDRKVRFRSAENLIAEIESCIENFSIYEYRFSDELFTVNKTRTMKLMEYMKGKNIHWKCSTRVDCVDAELLTSMKEAGCKEIAFGIESADQDVLKMIDKRTNIMEVEKALDLCNKIGIDTRALLMINAPGETIHTVDKNIEFLEKNSYTCASLAVFKPLPGSPVWNDPEKFGIKIKDRDLDKYNIYMWVRGQLDENNSEDVFEILTLPSVEKQIENRKRMLEYFYNNKKMNELETAINQKNILSGDKNDKNKI